MTGAGQRVANSAVVQPPHDQAIEDGAVLTISDISEPLPQTG
jgi:hypothetical protein